MMNRRFLGWLLLLLGVTLMCGVVTLLFYEIQCPNMDEIETFIPENAIVEISMERSICFGECPSYSLHVEGNGHIFYEGGKHTKIQGQHEAQMSQEDYQDLIQAFETYNFNRLVAEYHNAVNPICTENAIENAFSSATDAPTVTIKIMVNGRLTEIDHYHGDFYAPSELRELEDSIDDLTESNRWVE
jgi:hypothetical protein